MATLQVEAVSKTFGKRVRAVANLSFAVADQEFVFLLGPSGAGKTTTLRMVAGLESPDEGRVLIGGRDLTDAAPRDRNVAMVYDKNSLYPHLTVFDNMAYPLRLRRLSEAAVRERIGEVSTVLQISHLLERRPRELSGGQQQRVAIGRMLVRKADVFLMDEPISHLDAKLRAHMRLEFKKLQRDFNATILYVSHDQLEAMTMGDRIVVMDQGIVQQVGAPREVFERPANRFVAGFVGEPSMNFADCKLQQSRGRALLRIGKQEISLANDWLERAEGSHLAGCPLVVGIRPQHLSIANGGHHSDSLLKGLVYASETLGSETIVDIEAEGVIVRACVKTSTLRGARVTMGEPIALHVDPHAVYLFDGTTGKTLIQADLASRREVATQSLAAAY